MSPLLLVTPLAIVVFAEGGAVAAAAGRLYELTGWAWAESLGLTGLGASTMGWGTSFGCLFVSGTTALFAPFVWNALIRHRLGLHRPPVVHSVGAPAPQHR